MGQPARSALAEAVEAKLARWARAGAAQEYYALGKRGPIKEQVVSDLNRFGGAMGPYIDSVLQLRTVAYINATPIDHLPSGHRFVATMCPKRSTFGHFWAMAWEMGSTHIINLTHEADKVGSDPSDKRERYWPPFDHAVDAEAVSCWLAVPELIGAEHLPSVPGLSRYHVRLTHGSGQQRMVQVLWYSRWIDFADSHMIGTEAFYRNAAHVLALAYAIRDVPLANWPVVHCSAGVGRTGTFVVLLEALARLDSVGSDVRRLDQLIASSVEATRERRLWMVKSDFEFATIYAALAVHLREQLRPDFVVGAWRAGDFSEAAARPMLAAGAPELDACGRYNDPLKTPEAFYSRLRAPPSG
ncbi:hypothetical protein KFE25_009352 [Diacronema lutheri]|uniref:Protein tyrosine phosphatase n=1 Tax=Diacronema lutheri TaxID=2081491 RepID=A0A8J6CH99_DIALT|nr:hypothetical protein KFE25_009352 [Diacronema lutheri]